MKYTENDHRYALRKANKIRAINLLGGKCKICGEKNIYLLEFHHNIGEKEDSISQILDNRWSDFKKEVSKCKLLCSNCHAELHCTKPNNGHTWKNKSKVLEALDIYRCQKCGYHGKNYASLDFHHIVTKSKKFSISKSFSIKSVDDLLKEIKKCSIICKNCHKLEHANVEKFNVLKKLIYHKVHNPKEKTKPLDKFTVWKLHKEGKKQKEIAKYFGININSGGTISYILKLIKERIQRGELKEKNNELIRSICGGKKKKTNN